jgi:hypothetical protein
MSGRVYLLSALLTSCLLGACYVQSGPPMQPAPAPIQVVEAPPALPPPPPPEPVPVATAPDQHWVTGYHRWDGRHYVWERGHYEHRPHTRAEYVPAHWERHPHGQVWVDGRWR